MKKVISLFLTMCLILAFLTSAFVSAATQYSYNQAKALEYASNHWNDGVGLCAEFVSKCVRAGGVSMNIETFAGSCFKAILKNSYAEKHQLTLNEKGQATKADNETILAPGDVVVQYCTTCKKYPHILIFSEFDSNGKACYYAHNGALGNKTFTLSKNKALHGKESCNVIAYVAHFPQNGESQQVVDMSGNNTSSGNTSNNSQVKEEEKKPVVDMSTIDAGTQSTPKDPESTLSINLTNFPSSIENGDSVHLYGSISSNYIITKAEAMLWGSEGIGYYLTTIYPNSKSVRIENTDLSDGIYFEGMPGGTYTLEITAKDEKTTKEITKSIKISERKIEEDDDLYSADIDIEINNNKNFENTKKQKCGNNAYWNFNDGVLVISGTGEIYDYDFVKSPWCYYEGNAICEMSQKIEEIVIEDGITRIGNCAFYKLENVRKITIPKSLKTIGDVAFGYVNNVDEVYYNAKDCTYDGKTLGYAYNYFACGNRLIIGSDVERIGENVFYRGKFNEVICTANWNNISASMNGNDVLGSIKTESSHDEITVKVDGKKIIFDQPPVIMNGRILVPVRAIFEALDVGVVWFQNTQTVHADNGTRCVNFDIGTNVLFINEGGIFTEKDMDVPPVVINGRTLVPVRAIAESYDWNVSWDGNTQTVIIESE